jgi:hypothetical protein
MPKRIKPREIVIGRSYRYRGHVIHLEEQIPDGVICFVLDDTAAAHFVLRWDQFGELGEEITDAD